MSGRLERGGRARERRVERRCLASGRPLFSICIPQYGRTSFLLRVIESIVAQSFERLEICISDDVSKDGRDDEVISALEKSGRDFVWRRQARNRRYDGNLRTAIHLARGRYCFLLGNDDLLADKETLSRLHLELRENGWPEIALTNYVEFSGTQEYRRVTQRGLLGDGPKVAVRFFRSFSFVSGVVLDRDRAFAARTRRADGSEMYQTHLACRLLSAGGRLWASPDVAVLKNVTIAGEGVESYRDHLLNDGRTGERRAVTLARYARAAASGIQEHVSSRRESRALGLAVVRQVLVYTYPYWLIERKRVASLRSAVQLTTAMRPSKVTEGTDLSIFGRLQAWLLYTVVSAAGVLVPVSFFDRIRPRLYALAKSSSRGVGTASKS